MQKVYTLSKDGETKLSPNFRVREFRCKSGEDHILIDSDLVFVLQAIRTHFDRPVTINSAYRSEIYNSQVSGSATDSQHIYGKAADIVVTGVDPRVVYEYADKLLLNGGVGLYSWGVHVDVRDVKSRWNYGNCNAYIEG